MEKFIISAACALLISTGAFAKSAVVVIAHGHVMESWRKPVLALEQTVRDRLAERGITDFDYVRVAMMEYTEPSVASVLKDCEKEGVDTVFALPLFIAPSSHSEEDLPNIPGLKFTPSVREELKAEGTEFVHTDMKIVLGPTMYSTDILEKIMYERVMAMSKTPADEAVVILAHGDPERIGFWNELLQRTADYIKENSSITYTDGELVAMGMYMADDLEKILENAAAQKKRILVQGVYLTSNVKSMAHRIGMLEKQKPLEKKGVEIVYGDQGILPGSTDVLTDWIIDRALEWAAAQK